MKYILKILSKWEIDQLNEWIQNITSSIDVPSLPSATLAFSAAFALAAGATDYIIGFVHDDGTTFARYLAFLNEVSNVFQDLLGDIDDTTDMLDVLYRHIYRVPELDDDGLFLVDDTISALRDRIQDLYSDIRAFQTDNTNYLNGNNSFDDNIGNLINLLRHLRRTDINAENWDYVMTSVHHVYNLIQIIRDQAIETIANLNRRH